MIRSVILSVGFVMLFAVPISLLHAQNVPGEGSVGLTASFQGQQGDIEVPYWLQQNLVIAPLIGLQSVENSFTQIRVGVKPRFYQTIGDNFASYISGLVAFEHLDPEVGDSDGILNLGGGLGGEYYFDSHFSLGIEALLNIRLNEQNRLGTGAAITGSYYF